MKVLVTGATGFVGANIVRALVKQPDTEVVIIARSSSDFWRIEEIRERLNGVVSIDLTDFAATRSAMEEIQPDIVYHIATYGGFPGQQDKNQMIKTNLMATVHLLDAAVAVGVKQFINTGSSSEYGVKMLPMKETDVCEPVNFYGVTKLAATNYCAMIGKNYNYRVCTLRLFSPYGQFEDNSRLYPSIVTALQNGISPKLSKPDSVRDFIPIDQVVDVYQRIAYAAYKPGEIINVGSGRQQTIEQFCQKIATELQVDNVNVVWGEAASRQFEPAMWEADISKLKKLFSGDI